MGLAPSDAAQAATQETAFTATQETQQYRSSAHPYTFSVPSVWERVKKDGADVLYEDPSQRSTSLGVTVNNVRVASILDFGTLEAVGEKLLTAEKNKDSTMSIELVSSSSRTNDIGATLYDYEYEIDSTRGRKRILNTVTIFGSKLFILNAAAKCSKEEDGGCSTLEAAGPTLLDLRAAAKSFDVSAGPTK
ncbi:MAG: hypothetical protein WDW36_006783 [Sanguina aurantia]